MLSSKQKHTETQTHTHTLIYHRIDENDSNKCFSIVSVRSYYSNQRVKSNSTPEMKSLQNGKELLSLSPYYLLWALIGKKSCISTHMFYYTLQQIIRFAE